MRPILFVTFSEDTLPKDSTHGYVNQGPVILTKLWKISMLHVVLDWQQIYKTVLKKAFILVFWRFHLYLVLVSKNLKNSPSER